VIPTKTEVRTGLQAGPFATAHLDVRNDIVSHAELSVIGGFRVLVAPLVLPIALLAAVVGCS
jgi:hypothetical protein